MFELTILKENTSFGDLSLFLCLLVERYVRDFLDEL